MVMLATVKIIDSNSPIRDFELIETLKEFIKGSKSKRVRVTFEKEK